MTTNNTEAIVELRRFLSPGAVGMLVTPAPAGELHARPLTLAEVGDEGSLWFIVDTRTEWVTGLLRTDPVNFSVGDDGEQNWVSVSGHARVRVDAAKLDRLWNAGADAYFDDGKDAPYVQLLELIPSSAEYWDAPSSRLARLVGVAAGLVGRGRPPLGDSGTIDLD